MRRSVNPRKGLETVLCLLHKSIQWACKRPQLILSSSCKDNTILFESEGGSGVLRGRGSAWNEHTSFGPFGGGLHLLCSTPPWVSKGFDGRIRDLPPRLLSHSLFCFPSIVAAIIENTIILLFVVVHETHPWVQNSNVIPLATVFEW